MIVFANFCFRYNSTMIMLIVRFVFLLFSLSFCDCYDLVVDTNYGKIGGVVRKTRNNDEYLAFAGIPFAKPPVGNLRFANPEKPVPWNDIRNGSTSAPRCIQRNYLFYIVPPVEGSEDCLYLNVYVPLQNNPNKNKKEKLPVMVSIPWGGFFAGGGDEGYFDPSYLMNYNVIFVSFNYRLGVFGFLSTLDDAAPGNFGLKDQVLALEWVQENIEYFGGNREEVTIMGQSAGSGSVSLHIISPASKGLFQNAISQSGTAMAIWATPFNELQKTVILAQAQLLNCTDAVGDSTQLIKCFRNVPAEDIAQSLDAFKTFYQFPFTPYTLVVENKTADNPHPFLTETPMEYLKAGEFQKVPWLTGTVKNEGLLVVSGLLGPEPQITALNSSFSSTLTSLLALSMSTNDPEGLYRNISQQYLGGNDFIDGDEEWEQGLINLWSDKYFMYPGYQTVSLQVKNGHDSIYFYSFEYSGEQTFAGLWSGGNGLYNPAWSISHCDDLLYLFKIPDLFENQLASTTDRHLSDTMLNLWVNFATYGNPNPPENQVLENLVWEPLRANEGKLFTNDDIKLLNITGTYKTGTHFNISQGFNKERTVFWEENGMNS